MEIRYDVVEERDRIRTTLLHGGWNPEDLPGLSVKKYMIIRTTVPFTKHRACRFRNEDWNQFSISNRHASRSSGRYLGRELYVSQNSASGNESSRIQLFQGDRSKCVPDHSELFQEE